jgi:hypothetical protein
MNTAAGGRESTREDVTSAVASALADQENVHASELSPPLYDVIDPEALAELFRDTRGRVTFEYGEYIVTVDDEYAVEIRPVR